VGDRVTRENVLGNKNPVGSVIKINKEYVIVKWDQIKGDWHYTHEQSKILQLVDKNE
tara:strand:+ start:924 stop:1094 length:171 start_codon:yes stop_codon:yes gene_type:complete